MADLFQRDKSVISKHIKNVFEDGELAPSQSVANFATVQTEGKKTVERQIEFYNLDVIKLTKSKSINQTIHAVRIEKK